MIIFVIPFILYCSTPHQSKVNFLLYCDDDDNDDDDDDDDDVIMGFDEKL